MMRGWLTKRLLRWAAKRPPDIEIGGADNPYLRRWYVIPRNRIANIYLHQFLRDDDDRALHDHPWPNISLPLIGRYREIMFAWRPVRGEALPPTITAWRVPGSFVCRRARTAHRIALERDGYYRQPVPCWSLFVTGPVLRSWGFYCESGRWVHWRDFTAGPRGEVVGAGCGEPESAA